MTVAGPELPTSAPGGTAKLTWPGETKKSGAGTPLTVTDVPASSSGSGVSRAASVRTARFTPKAAAIAGRAHDRERGRLDDADADRSGFAEYAVARSELKHYRFAGVFRRGRPAEFAARAVVRRVGGREAGAFGEPRGGDRDRGRRVESAGSDAEPGFATGDGQLRHRHGQHRRHRTAERRETVNADALDRGARDD